MSNKKLHLAFGFVLAAFVGLVGSFTSAISFKLDFGTDYGKPERWGAVVQNMVPIHFTDNGNDFHGFIYFSDGIVDSSEEVEEAKYYVAVRGGSNDDLLECQKKVKGFYYNAERGERLWPLDGEYGDIEAENGIYTRCRKEGYSRELAKCAEKTSEQAREACENKVEGDFVDSYGYYGMVTHDADGQKFALVAGINYNGGTRVTTGNTLSGTFVRFANKYPVGFIYDVNGGLGFVGCEILGGHSVIEILNVFNAGVPSIEGSRKNWQKLFKWSGDSVGTDVLGVPVDCSNEGSAMNSLIKVVVDGLVGVNKGPDNKGIQGNQSNTKMQYFGSVSVNNMQLINYARQRAEVLCRGKWKTTYTSNPGGIVCVSSNSPGSVINASTNETLIVKGGANVKINDMDNFEGNDYYDIFVDGGNLLIEPDLDVDLTVFKTNGFKSANDLNGFRTAVNAAWSANQEYSGDDVAAGRFVRGNFIVNGSIKSTTGDPLENIYFFYGKLTSKDTVDDLEKTFEWKCNVGTGSDSQHVPCPGGWKWGGESWNNPYQNASLVIIDQNYPSPLYE